MNILTFIKRASPKTDFLRAMLSKIYNNADNLTSRTAVKKLLGAKNYEKFINDPALNRYLEYADNSPAMGSFKKYYKNLYNNPTVKNLPSKERDKIFKAIDNRAAKDSNFREVLHGDLYDKWLNTMVTKKTFPIKNVDTTAIDDLMKVMHRTNYY